MHRLPCSALIALLSLALTGCGFAPPPDPGPVIIPDDDDDDDSAGDDDDATAGDDDDATATGPLRAWAVLVERDTLGPGSVSLGIDAYALAAFDSGDPAPFGDPAVDGFALPGASLHPEQMGAKEGCDLLSSAAPLDPLPLSDPVGGVVNLLPGSAAQTLELEDGGGLYSWDGTDALPASTYSIGVKGGGAWPPATLDDALVLPPAASGFIHAPGGSISNLSTIEFRWTEGADPGGVEVSMFRWTSANQTTWAAVRCNSADDGSVFIDASSLAAGAGDISVTVSRARWDTTAQAGTEAVGGHLGAVRAVSWALTPVGR